MKAVPPEERQVSRVRRRTFLRGLGGAAIALPLLEAMGPPAGAAPRPKRLLVFFTPNGTVRRGWASPAAGAQGDFVLGEILAPLAPHRADLLVLQGIDVESSYHGPGDDAHWNGMGHMLTGTELVGTGPATFWGGGISVDQLVAQHAGATTKLASLELCVEEHPATVATRMSYLGPAQPVPPEPSPARAFQRLFGGLTPELRAKRKSVLDAVSGDLASLEKRLGRDDRRRIDAHLTAVRDVEARLDAIPIAGGSCAVPDLGAPVDFRDPVAFPAVGRLQMDLLVRALACDLTRVGSLMWSTAVGMTEMTWLGIHAAHHDLSHSPEDDAASEAALVAINRWYAGELAYLVSALRATPDGDGTLLDRTVVLWCNELSEGRTHSRRGASYVLAGGAGGAFETGRLIEYGGAAAGHVHGDLLVSLCRAMDLDVSTFGNPAYCHGELPGLRG